MAQIGTVRLETQNSGVVDVPVFEPGDSASGIYEFVRVETASGPGFIPVTDPVDATYPYLRVQSQNNGIVAVTDTPGSDIPDSVVAQYDATTESSTTATTSVSDQIGNFDLTGNATVITSGIDGKKTYRFDGTQIMDQSITMATNDPFAIVAVLQQQSTTATNTFYLDGGSYLEFGIFDNNTDNVSVYRGGTRIDSSSSLDLEPHLFVIEGFNTDQVRIERDGTDLVNGTASASNLTGLTLGGAADGGQTIEIDYGQVEVLQGHTPSELESVKSRLQSKWNTPAL